MVSIVVPVYKTEKYIDRCIESIVNQTYHDLEIILVDDGSPDMCPTICDTWAKKDNRIKVIHKKNQGLGMARNQGIDNAKGNFIYFVDSDDYIALDTIEKSYAAAEREKADIVSYGCNNVKADGHIRQHGIPKPEKYIYENEEVQEKFLPALLAPDTKNGVDMKLFMSSSGGGYSAELIRRTNWRFVSEREIISEDVFSLLRLYKDVKKVVVVPEAFYFYCENTESLTHIFRKDRFYMINKFYDACIDECNRLGYAEECKKRIGYIYMSYVISALKLIASSNETEKRKLSVIKDIVEDEKLQSVLSHMSLQKERFARKAVALAMRNKQWRLVYTMIKIKVKA